MSLIARKIDPATRPRATTPLADAASGRGRGDGLGRRRLCDEGPITQNSLPARGPIDLDGAATRSGRIEQGRAFAESVVGRAQWLAKADRQLLGAIYGEGREIGAVAAMLQTRERSVRRRIARLLDRLNSRRFAFVAVRHEGWPPVRRRVAASMILEGHSLRRTSEELRLSLYSVRRHYEAVNALFEASERGTP